MTRKALALSHYTGKGFRYDRGHTYENHLRGENAFFKPTGLWLSVDGEYDWLTWCRDNEFAADRTIERHAFQLVSGHDVLIIQTAMALEAFSKEYSIPMPGMPADSTYRVIDWPRVRKRYDGIIITPYQWSHRLRMDFSWYYGWDCASGCVWNLNAVHYVGRSLLEERVDEAS